MSVSTSTQSLLGHGIVGQSESLKANGMASLSVSVPSSIVPDGPEEVAHLPDGSLLFTSARLRT